MNTKMAITQFDNLEDKELQEIAQQATEQGYHWYVFDKTADKEFELRQLCEHYDVVLLCKDAQNFEEVKR